MVVTASLLSPEDAKPFSICQALLCTVPIGRTPEEEAIILDFLREHYRPHIQVMLQTLMHIPWTRLKAAIGLCIRDDVFRMSAVPGYEDMHAADEDAREILLHNISVSTAFAPDHVIRAIYERVSLVRIQDERLPMSGAPSASLQQQPQQQQPLQLTTHSSSTSFSPGSFHGRPQPRQGGGAAVASTSLRDQLATLFANTSL